MMPRKSRFRIRQMSNIPKHPTTDTPSGTNGQVGQTAIQIAKAQPCFWRHLQGATQQIANDIGMTDNDFKFVTFFLIVIVNIIISSIKVLFKCLFNPFMTLIRFSDSRLRRFGTWNCMTRSTFIQERIRIGSFNVRDMTSDNISRFLGAGHVTNDQEFDLARMRLQSLHHFGNSFSCQVGLFAS